MTYVITQKCVATCDTACVDACPCDCIHGLIPLDQLRAIPLADRAARFPGARMFINPDDYIDCASCVTECPVDAIYQDDELPAEHHAELARAAQFFRDRS